jgi:hypothetical protein
MCYIWVDGGIQVDLQNRIQLLVDKSAISQNIGEKVLQLISYFEAEYHWLTMDERFVTFITHMAMALQRISVGEELLQTIDDGAYAEIQAASSFNKAVALLAGMEKMLGCELCETEQRYALLHLCSLVQKED